jgi:hypothetical protein|tara:strand:- start:709 stop:1086 length:378 start_codon:yes stop_codon:yes gene_type:complete
MAKKKTGSDLLKSLGKNKKAQMKVLYPGMSTASKSKNIGKKISKSKNVSSSAKMLDSRRKLAGVKDKSKGSKIGGKLKTAAAVGVGYAAAKANDKRKSAKASDKAKDAADKLLKKQKDKKKHHSK